MPLSKNQIKYIHSLELKKNRKVDGVFLAEGPKVVGDLLGHFPCRLLVATREWILLHPHMESLAGGLRVEEVSDAELARASLLKAPQQVLAVFEQPLNLPDPAAPRHELCLALDGVQDPGNLGTIIRLADWFGVRHIFCSPGTVDTYSPKVIQASMGSVVRVMVHQIDLPKLIAELGSVPVCGTFLDGVSIYEQELPRSGLLIMGNEGNGISPEVGRLVNVRLCIPAYPADRADSPDSLNVALATAIACAEWRRQGAWR